MDRLLVNKILGKKNTVELEDAIYNLREIVDELSNLIVLSLDFDDEFIIRNKRRLIAVHKNIIPILDTLKNDETISVYKNSKEYLIKYLEKLQINIEGILENINPLEMKKLIYYSNMLMDLLLIF